MSASTPADNYDAILDGIVALLEASRRAATRAVNAVMTATYWEVGRQIVEEEQRGAARAGYGEALLKRLSVDLTTRFGRGFSTRNLEQMRLFYRAWPISQTLSAKSGDPDISPLLANHFPLPWSHYVRLLTVKDSAARTFYEAEALHGGWTVRQLDRQIGTQFYERTRLSRDKVAMVRQAAEVRPADIVPLAEEIKDPYILEFLDLRDEYAEHDLEAGLIAHLETFLLELGSGFTFVARQRRLRVGNAWYRLDLLLYHRRLRCLVVIDLKLGSFTHADAGQMHLYLNYAREHWTLPDENPPVGLILCTERDDAIAHYALDGLPNTVIAAEYRLALPAEQTLAAELARTRRQWEMRHRLPAPDADR